MIVGVSHDGWFILDILETRSNIPGHGFSGRSPAVMNQKGHLKCEHAGTEKIGCR